MDDPAHSQVDSAVMLAGEGRALRALARSLLGCSDADDVVQEGYAAAIEAPLAARQLGPWLAGTVRHLAKMLRRSETRRRRREHFAAREVIDAGSDPAVIAEQAEIIHEVAAAVRALDEPFRTVIVLRFWRGLLPEAIAQQLGVPNNTVRSRLQRGLERLRVRLDAAHGDRERWSAPLLAFAGVEPTAAASGVAAGGALLLFVGLLMKTKLFVAAAAVLVAALCVPLFWNDDKADTPVVAAVRGAPVQPIADSVEQTPAAAPEATREAVPPPAPLASATEAPFDASPVPVPPWLARFLVVDEDERPIADATITIWACKRIKGDEVMQRIAGDRKGNIYSGHEPNPLLELHTDAEGRVSTMFELECLAASASKEGNRTGDESLWHTRSNTTETKFVLETPILLRGIVLRVDGAPAASAKVTACTNGWSSLQRGTPPEPEPIVTGADGRFAFPVLRHGGYTLSAWLDGTETFREQCWTFREHPAEVVLTFPGAITLNGVIVDPEGNPVERAKVSIWREYHLGDAKQDPDDYETAVAEAGAGGRFKIEVRKHARYQLLASGNGHAASELVWTETTAVRPHAEVQLVLQRFAKIGGIVRHADGSPFIGVRMSARLEGRPSEASAVPSQSARYQRPVPATSDNEGRFELTVHPGTPWSIVAQPVADNSLLTFVTKGVVPGRDDVEIVISDDALAGCIVKGSVVLAADGQPLQDFEVGIVRFDDEGKPGGAHRSSVAKIEGNRFELPPLPLGIRIAIQVTPKQAGSPRGADGPHAPTQLEPFVTDREGVDLQVRIDDWGEQPLRVLAADGTPARRVRVGAKREVNLGSLRSAMPIDTEGRIVLKQCAPGAHRVTVWSDQEQLLEQLVTILPGLNPEIVLRLPAGAAGKAR